MKFIKIFAIMLAAATMTACSDDDNGLNTASGVTVDFEGTSMEVNENQDFFAIPVMVTGETNGDIKVTIEVEAPAEIDDNVAVENEQFIITSHTITIPRGSATGAFEVRNVWEQGVVNPDRTFNVKITDVQGAQAGSIPTATVTIINIDNAFTALLGRWTLNATNYKTGEPVSYVVTFGIPSNPDPEEEGHLINAWGYQEDADMFIPIWFDINESNGDIEYVGIPMDYLTSNYYYNFGDAVGQALLCTSSISNGSWMQSGAIDGTINEDNTEITFSSEYPLVNRLIGYPSFQYLSYTYGAQLIDIKFTKN
ncbi:MAG: hypothetical protein K2L73_01695 [Muribaculaceae bacterium]|nr:hypothetical protein [Muribaculaceae bacterium]